MILQHHDRIYSVYKVRPDRDISVLEHQQELVVTVHSILSLNNVLELKGFEVPRPTDSDASIFECQRTWMSLLPESVFNPIALSVNAFMQATSQHSYARVHDCIYAFINTGNKGARCHIFTMSLLHGLSSFKHTFYISIPALPSPEIYRLLYLPTCLNSLNYNHHRSIPFELSNGRQQEQRSNL